MDFLKKICTPFFQNKLRHQLQAQQRTRQTHNLWSARKIGFYFDASTEKDQLEWQQLAAALSKEGKKIQLLGYFNQKKLKNAPNFPFLTSKETNFWGVPKQKIIIPDGLDLLIVFNPKHHWALEQIAAQTQAAMKIGAHTPHPNDLDLTLELPENATAKFFLEQLDVYLDKIITTHGFLAKKN